MLSRRARAVDAWAAIKSLGRSGIAELVERTSGLAQRLVGALRYAGFEILDEVGLNQVLVAAETSEETEAVARALQSAGDCWCSATTRHGRAAIRVSICSWVTTEDDADRTAKAFRRARTAS